MEMLPVGVKRDGSYYTNIDWSSHTETDPMLWVCNVITDDHERMGGTYGSNTFGPVELVLGFFGEKQKVSKIRFYRNVGADISILNELARHIKVWYTDDDVLKILRKAGDPVDAVNWTFAQEIDVLPEAGWLDITLDKPFEAKHVRFTLVDNSTPDIEWTEMNEIRMYGE